MRRQLIRSATVAALIGSLAACQTPGPPPVILSQKSAVELRSMQSRVFQTPDQQKVFRAMLAVMLDLGYAVNSLEPKTGTITGNKLAQLDLTAAIAASNDTTTTVRANAVVKLGPNKQFQTYQVDDPQFYQTRFFDPLAQALFLDAMYETVPPETQKQADLTNTKN